MDKIGKYEVLEKIGVGGFGVVYKGRDPFIKRFVAIKTCSTEDEQIRQRFFREAEIAGNLHHRNVTTVYDFGFHGDVPYLVQEFLSGEDLDDLIKRRSHIPHERKLDYLLQIAAGLEYAHQQGVIHRDIKPANIRVLEGGRVKIMDFGIAKLANEQSQLTRTGTTMGTAAYLAPEQIHGGAIDARVDVFSFGVVAYELLTFRRPFQAQTISVLFYQILNIDPDPVERIWPECEPELAGLVSRCLQKDAEERFPGFGGILAELEPLLEQARAEATERNEQSTMAMPLEGVSQAEGATMLLGAAEREELAELGRRVTELLEGGDATAAEIELELARRRFQGHEVESVLEPLEQRLVTLRQSREEERRQKEKVEALLARGRELESGGSHQEAVLVLRTALEVAPDHPEVEHLLRRVEAAATRERRQEELQRATDQVSKLLAGGELEQAAAELERLEGEHGSEEQSLSALRQSLARLERRAEAELLRRRAAELEAAGRLEEALAELRRAQQADPGDAQAAVAADRLELEVAHGRQVRERSERLAAATAQAEEALASGDLERVARVLERAEGALGPADPLVDLRRRLAVAEDERRRASAASLLLEGRQLAARGELEAALERLRPAAELDPANEEARAALAAVDNELRERRRHREREAAIAAALAEGRALVGRGREAQAATLLARRRRELGASDALEALEAEVEGLIEKRRRAREQAREHRRQRISGALRSVPARVTAAVVMVGLVVLAAAAMWPERAIEPPPDTVSERGAPEGDTPGVELPGASGESQIPEAPAPSAPGQELPEDAASSGRVQQPPEVERGAERLDRATGETPQERERRLAAQRPPESSPPGVPREAAPPSALPAPPAPTTPAPATPLPATPPPATPPPATPAPATPAPAAPARPAPPTPTPAPAVDEARAVEEALARYRRAAESLDAAAVGQVWPGIDRRRLERHYADLESLRMTLDRCEVQESGGAATATCRMEQRVKPRVGRELTTTQRVQFRLTKRGDRWLIESLSTGG